MFKKFKLSLFNWLHKTKIYKFLLLKVIPYIRFTTYYTTFTGIKYDALSKVMQPGLSTITSLPAFKASIE